MAEQITGQLISLLSMDYYYPRLRGLQNFVSYKPSPVLICKKKKRENKQQHIFIK